MYIVCYFFSSNGVNGPDHYLTFDDKEDAKRAYDFFFSNPLVHSISLCAVMESSDYSPVKEFA